MTRARALRKAQQPPVLIDYLRQFLTPQVWKQARQSLPRRRAWPRWDLQPLLMILLAMTWAVGDAQEEKFETARGFYVTIYQARKRPGKTLQGFQKALSRVPAGQLRIVARAVRAQIRRLFAACLLIDGFEPMGCDGSRLECPRTAELEARLRPAGKTDAAPTIWVTALVHLGTGVLWSWRLGLGTADECQHLRLLLGTLSPQALIVADAAYMGYDLVRAILGSRRSFLLRMSSRVHLYTVEKTTLKNWREGTVYYWPQYAQQQGDPPIPCRLIRVPARGPAKRDVWLLTDLCDPARLPLATAAKFYRWRWRNEGVFRIYKRTIQKMKLSSRTIRLVHREAEGSLLALQLLLAHADLALRSTTTPAGQPVVSPRKVVLAIRAELKGPAGRRVRCYRSRLKDCRASDYQQTSPKARRAWPRRKPHKPPKPPILHTLDGAQKALLNQHIGVV